jgi:GH24 family phage-related lysozyme (muramidase)
VVDKNIHVPLTSQESRDCLILSVQHRPVMLSSTFYQRINAGDRKGACEAPLVD